MTEINIAGFQTKLIPANENLLKELPIDIYARYFLYEGTFKGTRLLFVKDKENRNPTTPSKCRKLAERISCISSEPTVFIFDRLLFVIRQRLIEQGVFFVVPGKYAFLPNLFVNAIESKSHTKVSLTLSPSAQYIFLYYLQHHNCRFSSIAEIQNTTPFSYLQIARAITELENLGLCKSERTQGKQKTITFHPKSRDLWNRAFPFLRTPIKKILYSDEDVAISNDLRISGVNALAHYSNLNHVRNVVVATSTLKLKDLVETSISFNSVEGAVTLQEWIYPPTILSGDYADPLSIWLCFREDPNPRIQQVLETIINEFQW